MWWRLKIQFQPFHFWFYLFILFFFFLHFIHLIFEISFKVIIIKDLMQILSFWCHFQIQFFKFLYYFHILRRYSILFCSLFIWIIPFFSIRIFRIRIRTTDLCIPSILIIFTWIIRIITYLLTRSILEIIKSLIFIIVIVIF